MKTESFAQGLYVRGKQARDAGDASRAKSLWKAAISEEPTNAQFHASLANLYTKEGNFGEALPSWREAHKHNAGEAKYANGLGSALRQLDQFCEAGTYFGKANALNPGNSLYKQNLDECLAAASAYFPAPSQPTPPQPRAYTPVSTQQQTTQAMRQRFKTQQDSIARTAVPMLSTCNPYAGLANTDTMHLDTQATANAQQQRRASYMRSVAREDLMCNDDGDHQVSKFSFWDPNSYPPLPMVMRRRGVPQEMYEADLAALKKIYLLHRKESDSFDRTAILTCGLIAFYECFREDSDTRNGNRVRPLLDEMNTRYLQYGITWRYQCVIAVDTFISYET